MYGSECFWPPENCGCCHDERKGAGEDPKVEEQHRRPSADGVSAFQEAPNERRIGITALHNEQQQGWGVELRYLCKRPECRAHFQGLDDLFDHQPDFKECSTMMKKEVLQGGGDTAGDGEEPATLPQKARPSIPTYDPQDPDAAKQRKMQKDWRRGID